MARRRRRSDREEQAAGSPAWMTTYGDLVTQLMIFFVLLFAMSSIDVQKFEQAIMSLQGAFGFLSSGRTTLPEDLLGGLPTPQEDLDQRDMAQMLEVKALLEAGLRESGLEATVLLTLEERGLVVRFTDSVLFDLGRAEIKPLGRQTLASISKSLSGVPNQVRVEGHTDNIPIRTANFPSNWELSAARATNVVRYLIEELHMVPNRLSSAGYGEYRPIAPNETPEGRQLNRRVDTVVLFTSTGQLEPK